MVPEPLTRTSGPSRRRLEVVARPPSSRNDALRSLRSVDSVRLSCQPVSVFAVKVRIIFGTLMPRIWPSWMRVSTVPDRLDITARSLSPDARTSNLRLEPPVERLETRDIGQQLQGARTP